jgi:hypothetical protein
MARKRQRTVSKDIELDVQSWVESLEIILKK